MKNISVEKIREVHCEDREYIMIKLNLCNKEIFAICVVGEEFAFESLGNDYCEANRIFELLVQNIVSEIHLEEILHDIKMKICF